MTYTETAKVYVGTDQAFYGQHTEELSKPAALNTPIITDALLTICNRLIADQNAPPTIPVMLHLKNKTTMPSMLTFTTEKSENGRLQIRLHITDECTVPMATRDFSFEHLYQRQYSFKISPNTPFASYPELIYVCSNSDTYAPFEGNGLGTSLIMQSDRVIEHAISHLLEPNNLPVVANIIDAATRRNRAISRNGWTSTYAKLLGYQMFGYNNIDYYKQYR